MSVFYYCWSHVSISVSHARHGVGVGLVCSVPPVRSTADPQWHLTGRFSDCCFICRFSCICILVLCKFLKKQSGLSCGVSAFAGCVPWSVSGFFLFPAFSES